MSLLFVSLLAKHHLSFDAPNVGIRKGKINAIGMASRHFADDIALTKLLTIGQAECLSELVAILRSEFHYFREI